MTFTDTSVTGDSDVARRQKGITLEQIETQVAVTSSGLHVYFLGIKKTCYSSPILTYCHDLPVCSW